MDDKLAFLELSALLTGLQKSLLDGAATRTLNEPIATEYARRLRGTWGASFTTLLAAYKTLAEAVPKPKVDDALLAALRATPEFIANEMVARQIVSVWYFSQLNDDSAKPVDGGFYERGAVWPRIRSHATGFSTEPHGYWAKEPAQFQG
jgi:hypothetical protein